LGDYLLERSSDHKTKDGRKSSGDLDWQFGFTLGASI